MVEILVIYDKMTKKKKNVKELIAKCFLYKIPVEGRLIGPPFSSRYRGL